MFETKFDVVVFDVVIICAVEGKIVLETNVCVVVFFDNVVVNIGVVVVVKLDITLCVAVVVNDVFL